jgi:carbamoyl-phosphate synthase large subunit
MMRAAAAVRGTPILTTLSAAAAAVAAIRSLQQKDLSYRSLQDHFARGIG